MPHCAIFRIKRHDVLCLFRFKFSDAPYVVWSVSIYQDVCLFVCVSGHLLFTGLSRIGLNNQEYFSLDNQELI